MTARSRTSTMVIVCGWLLVGAAVGGAQVPPRPAGERAPLAPVVITVGERVVRRPPERAFVTVAAESRARSSSEAHQQNARTMTAIVSALKGKGLGAETMRTVAYEIQPDFEYSSGRQRLVGFVARQTIEVRIDDLDRVGETLDLVVAAGATLIGGLRFDLKDRAAVEREALREAVADALARAEAAAAGAGRQVARVERIEEVRVVAEPPRPLMVAARAAEAAPDTPIAPGPIDVRAEVRLTAVLR